MTARTLPSPRRRRVGGLVVAALSAVIGVAGAEPARPGRIEIVEHRPPGAVPILGPAVAPVTIDFFSNPGDGRASAEVDRLLRQLSERHPRRLRVRYFLVSSGEQSNPHVEAALEAFAQGRFIPFLDAMLGEGNTAARVAELVSAARVAGMDPRRLERALADGRHAETARANHHRRRRHRVRRVPGLSINGIAYDQRPRSLAELEALYDAQYARALTVLDQGVALDRLYQRLLADALAAQGEPSVGPGAVDGLAPGERPPKGPAPSARLPVLPGGPTRGPPGAPVVIEFFCSFQTRNCAQTAAALEELLAAYPREVRLVFHDAFEPGDRRQEHARSLHRAARCAGRQGRFWAFYQAITLRARQEQVGRDAADELVEPLELDRATFDRCMRHPATGRAVDAAARRARDAGVRFTPAVRLGARVHLGARSFDELASLVDHELAPGMLERLAPGLTSMPRIRRT